MSLQRLLRLYSPIFEHTVTVAAFEGLLIWLSGCFCHVLLVSFFSSHCYRLRLSLVQMRVLIAVLQLRRSAAWVSQFVVLMLPVMILTSFIRLT